MRAFDYLASLLLTAALALPLAANPANSAPSPASPRYTVTLMGSAGSSAQDINNAGAVVGNLSTGTGFRAFINPGSGMRELGTLGGTTSYASRLNDAGHVVGSAQDRSGADRAFLYNGTTMIDLGSFGGFRSDAIGVNNAGYIVGSSYPPENPDPTVDTGPRPFLYPPGGPMQELGTLPFPNPYGAATDINESGQVVGYSGPFKPGDAPFYPFLFSNDVMTNLGSIGGDFNAAVALNDHGQVVGFASLPNSLFDRHAFLYSGGVFTDLDGRTGQSYSIANDINNLGQVVGASDVLGAFLYQGEGMESLNAMIDPAGGWYLSDASGINEFGQISATATRNGEFYAVRLDPVPEPPTVAMTLGGLLLLGATVRRRGSPRRTK